MTSARTSLRIALLALLASGCVRPLAMRGENWWSIRTAHVHVETDAGRERGIAEATRLEELHRALAVSFYHCADHDLAVSEVTILAHEPEMRALFPTNGGVSLHASDGYLALPRRMVVDTARLGDLGGSQIAAHELTHDLVEACFPGAPPWLHEGLASVFETILVPDGHTVVFGYPSRRPTAMPLYRHAIERGEFRVSETPLAAFPSAMELIHMSSDAFEHAHGGLAITPAQGRASHYDAAMQLAYMLALGPDAGLRARFLVYLESLRNGVDRDDAFASAFDGVDLDAAFTQFIFTQPYDLVERQLPHVDDAPPLVTAMSPAEAHLHLAEIDLRSSERSARSEVSEHLLVTAVDPAWRPQVLLLRATIDPMGARARVLHAEALAPDDLDVLRARAMLALRERDRPTVARLARRLEQRVDLRPSDQVVLAALEREEGRFDEAQARAVAVLRVDRSAWGAWSVIANVALDRGDRTLARHVASRLRALAEHRQSEEMAAAIDELEDSLESVP